MPPWHKPDNATSPISFGLDQGVISNQFKSLLKQAFIPGTTRLTASDLSKVKGKEADADALTDDNRSVHSQTTGVTGDSSVTSSRARQSAHSKAERRLVLTKARALELRSREKKMDEMALLKLFAPQVSKTISSKNARDKSDPFDASLKPASQAQVSAKTGRKKSVFFKGADPALEPDPSIDLDIAGLGIGLAKTRLPDQAPTPSGEAVSDAAVKAAPVPKLSDNAVSNTVLNVFEPDKRDIGAYPSEDGRFSARYSDETFEYGKRQSPSSSRSKGNSSPLRLNAVRDLAGLIEKIRIEEQPNDEKSKFL